MGFLGWISPPILMILLIKKKGFAGNNYRKIPCKTPIKGAYKRKSPAARYLP